jgi:hypothetical protein
MSSGSLIESKAWAFGIRAQISSILLHIDTKPRSARHISRVESNGPCALKRSPRACLLHVNTKPRIVSPYEPAVAKIPRSRRCARPRQPQKVPDKARLIARCAKVLKSCPFRHGLREHDHPVLAQQDRPCSCLTARAMPILVNPPCPALSEPISSSDGPGITR